MSDHSIWVLEYGFVDRFPASNLFAAQPNEGHRRMPYCFALVRSADRCALVDTGFADEATYRRLTAKYGRTGWAAPVDVLDRIGVAAAQVDTVILTHNHFDHAGCAGAFPNAHVYIQQREITQYEAALRRPPRFEYLTRSCQADLPALLAERERDGLGTRVDGEHEIAPGLAVRPAFDTHTAGSQVVAVSNAADGEWIFAGDNVYSYENLEGLRGDGILAPIAMTTGSATGWLDFADTMLSAVGGETRRIIPFHENRIWERFPSHAFDDGLHLAEISLAGGHGSLVEALT
ncbi:N-acyl homoserine lactonase family protein [Actinomadura madurae]|uniref:Glyoxylase, beta-lactamase superfamily II n=1 Tax=Actinomadura madurae TaxID=1993 RepID=A0A1I5F4D2_9ACTN|nr:N-acyl homoserine lactonase family protein [Actinomadura madurae]SFO18584.1 Glyoxylase, beta-lactamase superfamily II [Actinomadura madurae]